MNRSFSRLLNHHEAKQLDSPDHRLISNIFKVVALVFVFHR